MDHEISHVCGGLPVSYASLWATRCHHHEALTVRGEIVVQRHEVPEIFHTELLVFGPFDTREEITEQCAILAENLVAALQMLPHDAGTRLETL
jgi:hypothetical protein